MNLKNITRYPLIVLLLWTLLLSASAVWNIVQIRQNQQEIHLQTARSFFDMTVTTREWNSSLGGLYAPISEHIQPNPYLEVPQRDITGTNGLELTLINPAYMTRLIAELADLNDDVHIHITSLNPIRPENAPEAWEATALSLFEDGQTRESYFYNAPNGSFSYIAPLVTTESCLQCHAAQGYQVGEIRGGISVSFPVQKAVIWPVLTSHIAIAVVGAALILVFGSQLTGAFQKLEQQTEIDGLTQIYNRYAFDRYYHREFSRARRAQTSLAVIICDIDSFKAYNDTYGHIKGDECLKAVAQVLQDVLKRPGDLVARYGGEEFGVILPDTSLAGATIIADLLREHVEALQIRHEASQASKYITISLGVSAYDGIPISKEQLLSKVDAGLYEAKAAGKNIVIAKV